MTNLRRTKKKLVRTLFILLTVYMAVTMLQRFGLKPQLAVPQINTVQADY